MTQAIGGLSVGFQAASSMFDAMGQAGTLRGASAADNENARMAELQGAFDEADIRRRGRAVQGEAIAANAEGGNSGISASDLIYQNSLEIEYAAMSAKYGAAQQARGDRYRAAQEKQAARSAILGGVLRAGAAAVTGVADARNQAKQDALYRNRTFPGAQRLPMPGPPPYYTPPIMGPR